MAIIFDKNFYKSVPGYPESPIMDKIKKFAHDLEYNDKIMSKLSHGFYCRKIRSAENRYKFRISNGDRIVFCYQNGHDDICLLKYCNHDRQILIAKNIKDIHVSRRAYKEDAFDKTIDEEILKEIKQKIQEEDINRAYDLAQNISSNLQISKDLRKTITIKELQQKYQKIMIADQESGLLISTNRKSDLYETSIRYAMNRTYSEFHVVLAPYFKIVIPGTVINMPFFSERANRETDVKKYIDILVEDLYKKIGTTAQKSGTSERDLLLQGFFYDREKQVKGMYIKIDPCEKTIQKISRPNLYMATNNTARINSYLHALSLTNPKKIEQKNYEYLFC